MIIKIVGDCILQLRKFIVMFFSHFINISREWAPLTAIVNHHGEALFMNVMRLFGSASSPTRSSSSSVDHYVDIIFAFNKKYFDNLRQWMNAFVQVKFPSQWILF
jgi:hypothetical protein